jgi:hypothetical protein
MCRNFTAHRLFCYLVSKAVDEIHDNDFEVPEDCLYRLEHLMVENEQK